MSNCALFVNESTEKLSEQRTEFGGRGLTGSDVESVGGA